MQIIKLQEQSPLDSWFIIPPSGIVGISSSWNKRAPNCTLIPYWDYRPALQVKPVNENIDHYNQPVFKSHKCCTWFPIVLLISLFVVFVIILTWLFLVFIDIFFTFGPRGRRGQNVPEIALDRRFLGTIIAIFKMWLCPFNQPCIRHPMTKLK